MKNDAQPKDLPDEITGVVQGNRSGHGFVLRGGSEPDIYLPATEMRAVLHGDKVKVRVVRWDKRGRQEGRVTEIIERSDAPIIGRLLHEGGLWLVAPEDRRYGQDVLIDKMGLGKARAGQVVVVRLIEPPALYGQPVGTIVEVLGELDDPGMEIEIAVRKYGVPHEFSPACDKAARALPASVRAKDRPGRVDLTDVPLVTIDGEDARDFDDAVYCEPAVIGGRGKKPNGWRLLVAIADVSHYVGSGGDIDADAYERATSVYFPRRVIPMLPEKLSNGLCSLMPDEDRLCMVCDMLVNAKGVVTAYQFYPAVMNSHARLTYTEVAAVLTNTRGPQAVQREALVPYLMNLHAVFRALLGARERRGAIEFDSVETEIICNDAGRIEQILPRKRNDAHRLIEECMLAANVCAAHFVADAKQPALYRVHKGPTPEKLEALREFLKTLGMTIGDDPEPRDFQKIADATKDRPDAEQIQSMLLRSMSQAIYSPFNDGHFGLAYDAYAHFTSPIRRYPDLLVHRVIKAILAGRKYRLPELPTPTQATEKMAQQVAADRAARAGKDAGGKKPPKLSAEMLGWEAAGIHCSACERRADEASRDVEAWLKCEYMRQHLGEEFAGTVNTATSFGLFVELDDLFVEGLVHISELGGDYFRYDEVRRDLLGERGGIRYSVGTHVRVQVSRVDLDARRIDFRLVEEQPSGAGKRRGGEAKKSGKSTASGQVSRAAQEKSTQRRGRSARQEK